MRPRGAARELFFAKDQEVLVEGPAGTGKTRAVLEKVFLCALKYPGMRALLARKTRASMSQSVLVTLQDKVLPVGHSLHDGPSREYRQNYRLRNGSEIVVGGLDNADRIMSTEYDMIAVFEATEATLEDWEKLTTRLRHGVMPYQQALADCNPGPPGHWLNLRAQGGQMRRLASRHEDNPVYWDAAAGQWTALGQQYIATLDRLAGVRHQRLRLGQWAAAEGLVYPTLLEQVLPTSDGNVPPPLPSPAVRVAAGVDWGFKDPLAVVVGALCQDGRIYVVDEMVEVGMTPDVMRVRFKQLCRRWRIEALYCDTARHDLIVQMRGHDIPCFGNRVQRIEAGIAMVEARLRPADAYLKIYANCQNLLREAGAYAYLPCLDGRPGEAPCDRFNHAMDALRYLVCGMDRGQTLDFSNQDELDEAQNDGTEIQRRLGQQPESPGERTMREAREDASQRFQQAWGP